MGSSDIAVNSARSRTPSIEMLDGSDDSDGLDDPNRKRVDTPTRDEPDLALHRTQFRKLTRFNEYSNRKRVAQCLIDLALFAANISQLKVLLEYTPEVIAFYHFLLACVCASLCGQLVFALLILVIWERESRHNNRVSHDLQKEQLEDFEDETVQSDNVVEALNFVSVLIIFMITILNVCITGFGIAKIKESNV